MKKIWAIALGIICTFCCIVIIDFGIKNGINKNAYKTIYYNVDARNSCDYLMEKITTENSIIVLGSSELSASDNLAYPPIIFNHGNSDFNMILVGRGNMQSLQHAIDVGAFENNIKNGKIALIVSPQWFTISHLSLDAFASRFEESNFVEFLKNKKISKETKMKVANRVNSLLETDPIELERVKKYEDIYLSHSINPILWTEMSTYSVFRNAKVRFDLFRGMQDINDNIDYANYVEVDKIDFEKLLSEAEKIGNEQCTNNEYGVYDDYFNTYIKENYETYENSSLGESYLTSIEYDDLRLFLDVCKETNIEPLIINVPVNGRWYDYTGFPKADRQQYYQNIRDICSEYNVKIADFTDKEYEMYFLKDIMHLGWKGWVYLDEAVYNFYKE